jgi:hypothetical protein
VSAYSGIADAVISRYEQKHGGVPHPETLRRYVAAAIRRGVAVGRERAAKAEQRAERMTVALSHILEYDAAHNGLLSPVCTMAREGLDLSAIEVPPITEAIEELGQMFGHYYDGVDADQFIAELRGDDNE